MKRLLLAATMALITTSDIAIAAQQSAPAQRPARPDRPGRPPQVKPTKPAPRPPQVRPPVQRPRPPVARPPHRPPQVRPPVRPPVVRPPHRPGAGRPPNFRPIHGPGFHYPRGYRYRRWTIGLLLPAIFLSNAYYYNSYADLGVGPPPPGYRWVRYGPDLLLIQIRTRRVVDVIYGAFY